MANEFIIGVKIGAALAGNFNAIFASARTTALKLGQTATEIGNRYARMGEVMARALSHPTRNVGALRSQYERLGTTLDQLRNKQERLTASMGRGAALKNDRSELRGQAMETVGTAVALGAPIFKSVRIALDFEDIVKDIAITGDLVRSEELQLGRAIRDSALRYNQYQNEIARGVGMLVAEGMDPAKAEKQSGLLAKAATATRASFDDLAKMNVSFDLLDVKDMELAFNQAAKAGKQGSFELKDMAKWFPALGGAMKSLGITGNEAVVNMASRLQIARRTAGSNDEAGNNFKNFLNKLTSPDTQKDFEKIGVDLKQSMLNVARAGLDPVEAGVRIILEQMKTSAPGAAAEMQKLSDALANIKDPTQRAAELERRRGFIESLGQRSGLGEMFQDMQAMAYLLAELQNRDDLKKIMGATKTGTASNGKAVLDEDFNNRMEGANTQFDKFKIGIADIGITIGNALLPPLVDLFQEIRPGMQAFGDWAKQNPAIIRGVVGLVGGLLLGKLAFIGLKYGINLVMSPFNALGTTMKALSGRWTLLSAAWQAGRFAPAISGLRTVGGGLAKVGKFLGSSILSGFRLAGQAALFLGRGARLLGKVLGGAMLTGLRLVGQVVLFIGRAMLMNPIGLLITGIAVAAYLIYRNWDKIKPWFIGLWASVKTAFSGALAWFGALTKKFTDFGGMLIDGLVGGIKSKIGVAKESIVNLGASIKDWFTSTLGIKSPSRVFMGFGDNIAQGAGLGIARSSGLASRAAQGMANDTASAALQRIHAVRVGAGGAKAGAAGVTVHLTQTFNLGGGAKDVKGQVQQAAHMSLHELEQMMRRVMQQQERRSY